MPIFAPILRGTPPEPRSFDYPVEVTGWAQGGTFFRFQLQGTYDDAGVPVPEEICNRLEGIAPGTYISFDIEELRYNAHPGLGQNQNQIDYILAARACRPDLKFGYYSAFLQNANELVFPENGPYRQDRFDMSVANGGMDDLAAVVDFFAPRAYVVYYGPITDSNGDRVNGITANISPRWPPNSFYGFEEWKSYLGWQIDILRTRYPDTPIFPYIAPYTRTNNGEGVYAPPLDINDLFPLPYFEEMVDYTLDVADGAFFFDLVTGYVDENEITDVLIPRLNPLTSPPPEFNNMNISDCIYDQAYPDVYPDAHPCVDIITCSVEYIVTDGNGLESTSVISWQAEPSNDDTE